MLPTRIYADIYCHTDNMQGSTSFPAANYTGLHFISLRFYFKQLTNEPAQLELMVIDVYSKEGIKKDFFSAYLPKVIVVLFLPPLPRSVPIYFVFLSHILFSSCQAPPNYSLLFFRVSFFRSCFLLFFFLL